MQSQVLDVASYKEWRGCHSKRRFNSRHDAENFAEFISEKHGQLIQHAYRCEYCGGFHLTTKTEHY